MAKANLTPSFSLFNPSWEAVKLNLSSFLILALGPALYFIVVTIISGGIGASSSTYSGTGAENVGMGTFLFLMLIGVVASFAIAPALIYLQLQSARKKKVSASKAFGNGLKFFWRYFGVTLLSGLMIAGGLILVIVPGIIMIRRYFLANYYVVDQNLGVMDAMRKSADQTKPVSGSVYGVIGVMLVLAIAAGFLGIIPIIGAIAGTMLQIAYYCAPAFRYDEIKKLSA